MEKKEYVKPEIDKIAIDNEISVVLMSVVGSGSESMGDPINFPPVPGMPDLE